MKEKIQTFIVNLPSRNDRRINVLNEFCAREEFSVQLIEGYKNINGSRGLWDTLVHIVDIALANKLEYFLFCEDDHIFTTNYNGIDLLTIIENVREREGELLLGGVSYLVTAVQVEPNLFWIEKFHGLNFCIIFKQVFRRIKEYNFTDVDSSDIVLSKLTNKKFLIYPFISVQKEFGYSDITKQNAEPGKVEGLFKQSEDVINFLSILSRELKRNRRDWQEPPNWPNIPIYVYDECESSKAHNNILMKKNSIEYRDLPQKIGQSEKSIWGKIKAIIEDSISEEVIIICNSTHKFTTDYNIEYLKRIITQAYTNNIDILSGGDFNNNHHIIPITPELFWINSFSTSQFLIILKSGFSKILQCERDFANLSEAITLTNLTACITFPFISTIEVNERLSADLNKDLKDSVIQSFKRSSERFAQIASILSWN